MKIRPLFEKYQKYLLAFANTRFGRSYLSLYKWAKIKNNHKIIKVAPDGVHWWTGEFDKKGLPICQAVFFSKSPYLKKFRLALEGIEIAKELISKIYKPEFVIPHFQGLTHVSWLPLLARITDTFNPDADPESTSTDGYAGHFVAAGEAWGVFVAGGGIDGGATSAAYNIVDIQGDDEDSKWRRNNRGFFLFDSSSLGDTIDITSAVMSVYGGAKSDPLSITPDMNVYSSSPASDTDIVAGDYDSKGNTAFSDAVITYANWDTSGYNDWTLNASGRANISKTSISKFSTANVNYDHDNSAPSWSEAETTISGIMADTGSNKPKLAVTYALPIQFNTNQPTFLPPKVISY